MDNQILKPLPKTKSQQNKQYYEKIKEQHKIKMRQYYYDRIKLKFIDLYLYNNDGTLNRDIISQYDKANEEYNDSSLYKIRILNKLKMT